MEKGIPLIAMLLLLLCSCSDGERVSQTRPLLGTTITITVIHEDPVLAKEAIDSAFDEILRVERIFSIYDNASEVSLLNMQGYIDDPSPEFLFVLDRSLYFSRKSGGAFDPSVQPLLDLYTESFSVRGIPPTQDEIDSARSLVDHRKIRMTSSRIELNKGMSLTFGGIAKGYAVDRAEAVLRKRGVTKALIVAGGQIQAIGTKEDGEAWEVGLRNPRNASESVTVILAKDFSVSTSGDYERYFDPTLSAHHIMDPKTGRSAGDLISVTVIAREGINADALSTAVFVLGPVEGMALIEGYSDAECLLITKDREVLRSEGFSRFE